MNLKLDQHLGLAFEICAEKQKGQKSMSMVRPTRIYFEIYMYLRAQCGVSLHTSEPSIGDILPDVKGLRENFEGGEDDTRQKACYMKSHNAEILTFAKA